MYTLKLRKIKLKNFINAGDSTIKITPGTKAVGVYGPNGSGKTTLVKALKCAKSIFSERNPEDELDKVFLPDSLIMIGQDKATISLEWEIDVEGVLEYSFSIRRSDINSGMACISSESLICKNLSGYHNFSIQINKRGYNRELEELSSQLDLLAGKLDGLFFSKEYSLTKLKEAYKDFINSSYISVLNIDCPNVANIYHDMGNVESALVGTGSILCKEEDSNPDSNNMPLSSTHLPLIMPFSPKQDISNISYILKDNLPFTRFNLKDLGIFEVYGIGEHNAINASMAILSALEFLDIKSIKENLLNFRGIKKRFDILENLSPDSPCIIDDYAHHPTEILATLNALKIYKDLLSDSKLSITAIFQPHKYSRLRDNLEAFCNCFHHCDELVILPVWAAGEDKIDFDFESLFAKYNPVFASRIKRKGKHIALINECGEEFRILQSNIIIGLGAGDITYQIRGEK